MKVKLFGKNLDDARPLLAGVGMEECDRDFELVIAHGGDGTFLAAEREWPGVPKLPIRDRGTAPLCPEHSCEKLLAAFVAGQLEKKELRKVECDYHDGRIIGVNDVFLHNFDRSSALRYRVRIDGVLYANEIVGDGVGLSSVHGSTAYYRSITHSIFRVGIGLAFSNSTEEVNHLVLAESASVEIEVVRGPGLLVADNSPEQIRVDEGEKVTFRAAAERGLVYGLAEFMCPRCRTLRHPNKLPFRWTPLQSK
ncbi:MAG: hypothetical protein PHI35_00890 [Victivallaceae bacterium]|nr:hypothetical protein [Victivallaceae bacterium]